MCFGNSSNTCAREAYERLSNTLLHHTPTPRVKGELAVIAFQRPK